MYVRLCLYSDLEPVFFFEINDGTVIRIGAFRKNDHCMKFIIIQRKWTEVPDRCVDLDHASLRYDKCFGKFRTGTPPDAGAT